MFRHSMYKFSYRAKINIQNFSLRNIDIKLRKEWYVAIYEHEN